MTCTHVPACASMRLTLYHNHEQSQQRTTVGTSLSGKDVYGNQIAASYASDIALQKGLIQDHCARTRAHKTICAADALMSKCLLLPFKAWFCPSLPSSLPVVCPSHPPIPDCYHEELGARCTLLPSAPSTSVRIACLSRMRWPN